MTLANLSGQTLGQYRVIKPIGSGGMARIYLAKTPQNKYVALKVLLPHLQNQPDFAERFLREAQHATRLRHKHIVSVRDYQQMPDGTTFFAMDWIDDGSLAELIQSRQKIGQRFLALREAAQIVGQIATALDYAHKKGVVHRDIKPSNILLGKDGRAMLADFGVAKVAQATTLTRPGEQPGTPAYMAPEQAQGAEVSQQTDVYALGIVFYEMLAGRPPFQGDTSQVLAVLYQQVHETPPALKQFNPQIPSLLETVIKKVLAKKPAERYPSAEAFAKAVWQAVDETTKPTQSFNLPLVIGVGSSSIVVLLCLLALLWYNTTNDRSQISNQLPNTNTITITTTMTTSEVVMLPTSAEIVVAISPTPIRDDVVQESGETAATAIDDDDTTIISSERPILLTPADEMELLLGETVTLNWRWQPLAAGQQYQITIRDAAQQVSTWRTLNRQLPLSADLAPGRYTWLVMVTTIDNEEMIRSAPRSFTVVAPTPTPNRQSTATAQPIDKQTAPTLLSPEDGFSRASSENITLRWDSEPSLQDEQCYVLLVHHKQGIDYIWLTDKSYELADDKRWLARPEFGPDLRWQVVIAEEQDECDSDDVPTDIEISEYSQPRSIKWINVRR